MHRSLLFGILDFIFYFTLSTKIIKNTKCKDSEIYLIMIGGTLTKIYDDAFSEDRKYSELYVNGIIHEYTKYLNLENGENNITIKFNYQVKNCYLMFNQVSAMKEIDLSNFDFSEVTDMTSMFKGCTNLEKINFGNINTSSVTSMFGLFENCKKISSIDLSMFNFSKVSNMDMMFSDCSNLEKINFGNIDTSSVTNMAALFQRCEKFISIDLSNFVTYKVEKMDFTFSGCKELKYLNLSFLDVSNLNSINSIFYQCNSLLNLNLFLFSDKNDISINNFNDLNLNLRPCQRSINSQYNTFIFNCSDSCRNESNIKIDINNNECSVSCKNNEFEYHNFCFIKCPKGTITENKICVDNPCIKNEGATECLGLTPKFYYLDNNDKIYKKCYDKCIYCYGFGDEVKNNCTECLSNYTFLNDSNYKTNCYEKCEYYYYYFDENNTYHCTNDFVCPDKYKKLVKNKNKCIDYCINDDIYKFEYNNTCYSQYPTEYIYTNLENSIAFNNENISIIITELDNSDNKYVKETNFQKNESEFAGDIDITENSIENINLTKNTTLIYDNNTSKILEQLFNDMIKILNNNKTYIDNDFEYIKKYKNYIFSITRTSSQINNNNKNNNNAIIDLGQCETILKKENNILLNDSLYILKIVTFLDEFIFPIVNYAIYYPFINNNFTQLNLNSCKDTKINISFPVNISNNEIDQYNLSSDLYNDLCYTLTNENNIDKTLKERRKEIIDNNKFICQEGCVFSEYDINEKRATCSCFTKIELPILSEIKIDKKKLLSNFKNIKNIANFKMLNCIYLMFNKKNIFFNSSNYIFIFLFIFGIISIYRFIFYNYPLITKNLNEIWKEKTFNFKSKNRESNDKINEFKESKIRTKRKRKKKKKKKKINDIENNKKFINNINSKEEKNLNINIDKKDQENFHKKINNEKNIKENEKKNIFSDIEINLLTYKEARKYDKRTYLQYYISLIKTKHILIFSFYNINDYNSQFIKIYVIFDLIQLLT